MPMVRAMRLLNAVEAGTTTGAQLQTLLTADPGRLAEFNVLLGMRGQTRRMAASSTAMTAVIASSTAMAAVAASSTAMTAVNANDQAVRIWILAGTNQVYSNFASVAAVIASSTAMAAVIASSTAMTAVIASSTAMAAVAASSTAMAAVIASSTAMAAVAASSTAMAAVWSADAAADAVLTSATARSAVYNSDTALAALQASPVQVQRQIGIGGRTTSASTSSPTFTYAPNGTRVILLRAWLSGNEDMALQWGRGLATDDVAGGLRLPNGDNLGATTAAIGRTTTYANSGTFPNSNNANANVVSAANGLRRRTWSISGNTTQNVIYITV